MTLDEINKDISFGLPDWQAAANMRWLQTMHHAIKEGGILASPGLCRAWRKIGPGFMEIDWKDEIGLDPSAIKMH